jgi:hypothetical protein
LPEELWQAAGEQQEARREIDPWEATLRELIDDEDIIQRDKSDGRRRVTADALFSALGIEVARRDRPAQLRVSQIMQTLGFSRGNVWVTDEKGKKRTMSGYIEHRASRLGPKT